MQLTAGSMFQVKISLNLNRRVRDFIPSLAALIIYVLGVAGAVLLLRLKIDTVTHFS